MGNVKISNLHQISLGLLALRQGIIKLKEVFLFNLLRLLLLDKIVSDGLQALLQVIPLLDLVFDTRTQLDIVPKEVIDNLLVLEI